MTASSNNVWQLPYVNLFKHLKLDHQDFSKVTREGDISHRMDKTIKSTVFRIAGSVPASNYILIPKKNASPIALTGKYFYLQFKPLPTKYFVFHLEVVTQDELVIRVSVSNLFKEFKSTSTWIQFPYIYTAPVNSVDGVAAQKVTLGAQTNYHCPAPQNSRWTLLCMNLKEILSKYVQRQYSHIKTIQLCSSMLVKNVYTSDTDYDPEVSFRDAQKLAGLHKVSPIPREMAFPVTKNETWNELYCHVRLPSLISTPFETHHHELSKTVGSGKNPSEMNSGSCRRKNMLDSIPFKLNQDINKNRKIQTPPNFEGGGDAQTVVAKATDTANDCVHIYPNLESPRNRNGNKSKKALSIARAESSTSESTVSARLDAVTSNGRNRGTNFGFQTSLKPDPIAELSRVLGANVHVYPNCLCWALSDSCLVYASSAIVVCVDVSTDVQRFFVGHTDSVTCLSVNKSSTLLASAQRGFQSMIRVWKFSNAQLITIFRAPDTELTSLEFSSDSKLLCGFGKDCHGKSVIALWDSSDVTKSYEAPLIAKAHADVHIKSLKLNYFNPERMVSCGRENIRFWRLKQKSLRSCPVDLGDYATHYFAEVSYQVNFSKTKELTDPTVVYCCSTSGFVLEIDTEGVALRAIKRLVQSTSQEIAVSLNSLKVTSEYCVIGSKDGFLRVWALDFSSVLLEYDQNSEIVSVLPSEKGDKIVSVSNSNQVGMLNIVNREFLTLQTYHKKSITSCDVSNEKLIAVTCVTEDQEIYVWDLLTGNLAHNFNSKSDNPTEVRIHPSFDWIVCGFESGSVRVLDMRSAQFVYEFNEVMRGVITGLVIRPCGKQVIASCSLGILGSLCVDPTFAVLRILPSMLPKKLMKRTLNLSPDGQRCIFIGPSEYVVSVIDSKTLNELLRIDITQLNSDQLSKGVIEKGSLASFTNSHILLVTTLGNLYFLDLVSGKRLNVQSVHKDNCTAIESSKDDSFFFTAGDKFLKVWDYKLRFDVNCQMLTGHRDDVSSLHFIPKLNSSVVSVGEHVLIWRIRDGNPSMLQMSKSIRVNNMTRVSHDVQDPRHGDAYQATVQLKNVLSGVEIDEAPREMIPEPTAAPPDLSSIAAHDDSIVSELEVLNISDSKVDHNERFLDRAVPNCGNFEKTDPLEDLEVVEIDLNEKLKEPTCFKHFKRKPKDSKVASVHFSAPENQAGMKLKSMVAFNGNARDNILWKMDPGLLYYTTGISIVIEDLSSNGQKILKGHVSEISTIAIQPSGKYLASASGETEEISCQIIIWDLEKNACHNVTECAYKEIVSLKYSNDSRFLLSLSDFSDRMFTIWNSESMQSLVSSKLDFVANAIAWDYDSPLEFCIVGSDCSVSFWILEESSNEDGSGTNFSLSYHSSDSPIDIVKHRSDSKSVGKGHAFVSLSYAGLSILYIGSDQGIVSAWDTRSNTCYMHWVAGTAEITHISALGTRLITGSMDNKLKLWTVVSSNSNQPTRFTSDMSRVPGNGLIMEDEYTLSGSITGGSFDDNLELGLVGTSHCIVWYINWLERNAVRLVNGNSSQVTCSIFYGSSSVAVGSLDGGIRLYSVHDNELLTHFKTKKPVSCLCYLEADPKDVTKKRLFAGFHDGSITVFDLNKCEVLKNIAVHTDSVTKITLAPERNYVLSASESGSAALIDSSSFVVSRMLSDHKGSTISDVSFSPFVNASDKEHFAIASLDNRISIWQSCWPKERCVLCDWITISGPQIVNEKVNTVVHFSPTEKNILLYSGNLLKKAIRFYSMRDRRVIRELEIDCYPTFLESSLKGNLICIGTGSWLLKLVDYNEGSFQDFLIHSGKLNSANFSQQDPNQMLVSCAENEVAIWKISL
ncbi:WD repeat-containing protein 90-like [Convolutriloba macropyga]|uniref:WD repeat-containing protein 90-like n=1 Tax=Convolutriloba macropyga TaxID=536237 RepID=UPI003F51BF55